MKLSHKYVEEFFRQHECELLSAYFDSDSMLKYRCLCGRISEIRWNKFRIGQRCKKCGRARAYYRDFGLCRLCFRQMAHQGLLPGVVKASW